MLKQTWEWWQRKKHSIPWPIRALFSGYRWWVGITHAQSGLAALVTSLTGVGVVALAELPVTSMVTWSGAVVVAVVYGAGQIGAAIKQSMGHLGVIPDEHLQTMARDYAQDLVELTQGPDSNVVYAGVSSISRGIERHRKTERDRRLSRYISQNQIDMASFIEEARRRGFVVEDEIQAASDATRGNGEDDDPLVNEAGFYIEVMTTIERSIASETRMLSAKR